MDEKRVFAVSFSYRVDLMGRRGPKHVPVGELEFWEKEWHRLFKGLLEGLPSCEIECLDPHYMTLQKTKVGENRWKIEPLKSLYPSEPHGEVRFGSNGRLRRRWEEIPDHERRKLSFPLQFVRLPVASIPPEPEIFDGLLQAKTARQVRMLCKRSQYWQPLDGGGLALRAGGSNLRITLLNCLPDERRFAFLFSIEDPSERFRTFQRFRDRASAFFPRLQELYEHADEFLALKQGPRFPRSTRPSSREKQLRFLARGMAGITVRRSPRTAIDALARQERHHPRPN